MAETFGFVGGIPLMFSLGAFAGFRLKDCKYKKTSRFELIGLLRLKYSKNIPFTKQKLPYFLSHQARSSSDQQLASLKDDQALIPFSTAKALTDE